MLTYSKISLLHFQLNLGPTYPLNYRSIVIIHLFLICFQLKVLLVIPILFFLVKTDLLLFHQLFHLLGSRALLRAYLSSNVYFHCH